MNRQRNTLLLLFICFSLLTFASPNEARAGWGDTIRSSVNKAKSSANSSYNKARKKTQKTYRKTKQRTSSSYKKSKERVRKSYSKTKNKSRDSYKKSRSKAYKAYSKKMDKTRQSYSKAYSKSKEKTSTSYNKSKQYARDSYNRSRQVTRDKYSRSKRTSGNLFQKAKTYTTSKLNKAKQGTNNLFKQTSRKSKKVYTQYKNTSRAKYEQARRKLDSQGRRFIGRTKSKYGTAVAAAMGGAMAKSRTGKETIARRSVEAMNVINAKARDPRVREKALVGAVAASAVAYYAYTHQDELKYRVINKGMETIVIPVNGTEKNLEQIYSEQVLKLAPSLEGTQLAEDPAAMLAYGVVTVGKEDMINHLEVIPDGHGGMATINETIQETEGADEAIAALNVSSSIEGMAMSAAENGDLGQYGSQFAATYNTMDNIGR